MTTERSIEDSTDGCPSRFAADSVELVRAPWWLEHQGALGHSRPDPGLPGQLRQCQGIMRGGNCAQRCPLCSNSRRAFYCKRCVATGDFVHSSTKLYERFAEKNLRLFALKRDIDNCKQEISDRVSEEITQLSLKEDIKLCKTRIKYLKHLIDRNKEKKKQNTYDLEKFKCSNLKRNNRLPEFEEKVLKIKRVVVQYCRDMGNNRTQVELCWQELAKARGSFVEALASDVFPVVEVLPSSGPECQPDAMMDCLADAMRTSYIHGRWVKADRSGELQYRIVAPCLSGSGDYTAVYAWMSTNKEGGPGGGEPHPAHTISAGLSLAAQLLGLVAGVMASHLPARLDYSDFGVMETSEYRFAKKVAKLNMNVVNICLKNGVDPDLIRPCHTLHNIKLLCTSLSNIGQHESMDRSDDEEEEEVDEELLHIWETAILKEAEELRLSQLQSDDSDDEADSEHLQEWESVPADTPDLADPLSSSPSNTSLATAGSFVSSTVSSLLWGLGTPKSPKK